MKRKMNVLGIAIWLCCLCSAIEVQAAPEMRAISVKVVSPIVMEGYKALFLPNEPLPEDGRPYQGGWQRVTLNSNRAQGDFKVKTREQLVFYSQPKVGAKPLGKLRVGAKTNLLMMMLPDRQRGRYQCVALDDASPEWGCYFIFNLTQTQLRYSFDEKQPGMIQPKKYAVIKGDTSRAQRVKISTQNSKEEFQTVRETAWKISSDMREFIFYFTSADGKRVQWKHVTERRVKDDN